MAPTSPALSNVAGTPDTASSQIGVDAVEIEGDRLSFAGSAKERTTVRVYLDDQPIAERRAGAGERYIASARADVAVGEHTIRVDALDATGRVSSAVWSCEFQTTRGDRDGCDRGATHSRRRELGCAGSSARGRSGLAVVRHRARRNGVEQPGSVSPSGTGSLSTSSSAFGSVDGAVPGFGRTVPTAGEATPNGAAAPTDDAASGSEPPTVRQAPLEAAASRVIIRRGDTLCGISRETYGRGSRYTVIYLANGDQIRNPDRIYPGQVFRVPEAAATAEPPRG